LSVENNTANSDFQVVYRMSVVYDDTNPISSNTTALGFTIDRNTPNNTNNVTTYRVSVKNSNTNSSMGLVIMDLRVPSCYQLSLAYFETLRSNGLIDYYELREGNTEAYIYIRSLKPGETRTFNIDLIKIFEGICVDRPSSAFEYYNP
jgi:hypothetical protein